METDTLNKLTRATELPSKRTKGRTEYIYFIFLTLLWCFVTWNSGTLQYMWSILMAKVNTMLFSVGFNHSYYRMTCNFCWKRKYKSSVLWVTPPVTDGFPYKKASNAESTPNFVVIMLLFAPPCCRRQLQWPTAGLLMDPSTRMTDLADVMI